MNVSGNLCYMLCIIIYFLLFIYLFAFLAFATSQCAINRLQWQTNTECVCVWLYELN